jgi:hypothetical protein
MAHSDVEADEWVHAIRGLILYRRDPARVAATLPASLHPPSHTQPMAISHTTPAHPHSSTLLSSSLPNSSSPSPSPSYPLHANLPTPPDVSPSPSTLTGCHVIHKQRSAECLPFTSMSRSFPPPSPPSSSSEASMASSSNASSEPQPPNAVGERDTDFRFRVHVKEALGLPVSGAVDLVLGGGRLALHTPDTGYYYSAVLFCLMYKHTP